MSKKITLEKFYEEFLKFVKTNNERWEANENAHKNTQSRLGGVEERMGGVEKELKKLKAQNRKDHNMIIGNFDDRLTKLEKDNKELKEQVLLH